MYTTQELKLKMYRIWNKAKRQSPSLQLTEPRCILCLVPVKVIEGDSESGCKLPCGHVICAYCQDSDTPLASPCHLCDKTKKSLHKKLVKLQRININEIDASLISPGKAVARGAYGYVVKVSVLRHSSTTSSNYIIIRKLSKITNKK